MPPAVQSLVPTMGSWPVDWFVLGLVMVAAAIDAFRGGTLRAAVFSLAAPLAVFVYAALPKTAFLARAVAKLETPALQAALFAVILVILCILLYRIVPASFGSGALPMQGLAAGLAVTIVLAVVWLQIPALISLFAPSQVVQMVFGQTYAIFWLLVAYGALAFVRR